MGSITLSPSSARVFHQCPLRWHNQYVLGLPDETGLSHHLLRGAAGHAALEAYYRAAPAQRSLDLLLANAKLHLAGYTPAGESDVRELHKAGEAVEASLAEFWRVFQRDEELWPVATEVRRERGPLHGILDGIADRGDRVWLIENKFPTTMQAPTLYLLWSPQTRDYAWLLDEWRPVYVVYNVLTVKSVARYGPHLIPLWQQAEAGERVALVAARMSQPVYAVEGVHCYNCPYMTRCTERLIGSETH